MSHMPKSQEHCRGCTDDFYNGRQNFSCKNCWNLKDAKVVTRYRIHWWTEPTRPGAFTKVKTYDCHREPGQHAFYEKLPSFAVDVR